MRIEVVRIAVSLERCSWGITYGSGGCVSRIVLGFITSGSVVCASRMVFTPSGFARCASSIALLLLVLGGCGRERWGELKFINELS